MTHDEYREAQLSTGLSNVELANALGVTPDTIVKRKHGRARITKETEIAIKTLLGEKSANDTND